MDVGQYLPLRRGPAHSPAHQASLRGEGGHESMNSRVQLASRRDFLSRVFSASALILGARFIPAEAAEVQSDSGVEKATWNPNVWVGLNTDGSVVIIAHRSEMGTGIRTSLPMVLAD